jgi:hypothetical protein
MDIDLISSLRIGQLVFQSLGAALVSLSNRFVLPGTETWSDKPCAPLFLR